VDTFEALYTTRAMRRLAPDPVPEAVIARIVDAGLHAPCPGGQQPWRFLVVNDRAKLAELGALWRATRDEVLVQMPGLYHRPQEAASSGHLADHFDDVPVLIVGYGPEGIAPITVVPALWSMCLAARAEGLGSTFTTLLVRVQPQVDAILGLPDDSGMQLIGALPIGYPLGRWGIAARQPVGEVTYLNEWGVAPDWEVAPPALS
jgi:nitroreductase